MIHERAKILHYLRETYRVRYEKLLPDLGLERGAVEGQLQLSKNLKKLPNEDGNGAARRI